MSSFNNPYDRRAHALERSDSGVVAFFNSVYAWMCAGLGVTATVAWLFAHTPALQQYMFNNRGVAVAFLVGGVLLSFAIQGVALKVSAALATVLFLVYSAVVGVMLSGIFIAYSLPTLGGVFLITAGMFGATSVYGFVTKRDLSGMRGVLIMAVVGLFLATLVNIFWANSTLYWIVTYVGVIVFTALTAYDTQMLRNIAHDTAGDPRMAARYAIVGSLHLYLDFINMFIFLLRILGGRKD
jgi:uncharacterized protein